MDINYHGKGRANVEVDGMWISVHWTLEAVSYIEKPTFNYIKAEWKSTTTARAMSVKQQLECQIFILWIIECSLGW